MNLANNLNPAVTVGTDLMPARVSGLVTVWRRFRKNRAALAGLALIGVFALAAVFAPFIAPYDPIAPSLADRMQPPSWEHFLGTDYMGRDILSRIIYGGRISLEVGIISVGIALVSGVLLGSIAGYFGGLVDLLFMRLIDIMMAFPSILLAIAIVSVRGPGLLNAMIAIGIVAIPNYARIVRSSVLSVKEHEYIEAARALGVRNRRIIFRHVLPNCMAPLIVQATLGVATAVLDAAALSFLGLGVQPPTAEWGGMLSDSRSYLRLAPWTVAFPGVAILLSVMGLNLVGDGLRDALDPRLKQ